MRYFFSIFLLLCAVAPAELIPAARKVDWTAGVNTGILGGIPTDRATVDLIDATQSPYNADKTGATDAAPAILAARDAAIANPAKKGVYLPAGTYRIDSTLSFGHEFNGKTLRGAGWSTLIDQRCNNGIVVGTSLSYYQPSPPQAVTAGLTKGSTTITIPNIEWSVGMIILIGIENDPSIPVVSTGGYDLGITDTTPPHKQQVMVTAIAGDNMTFWPPLHSDYGGGTLDVYTYCFSLPNLQTRRIGVEDLMIDATNYTGGPGGAYQTIGMGQAYECWFKNVKAVKAWNYAMGVGGLNCEVRGSYAGDLKGSGSNGAGLLFGADSCLIEDNIFVNAFPAIEVNGGSSGNAFTYNFGNGMANTNHAPHNRFNLYEGNAFAYAMSDGYFGSESEATWFRTQFWQQEPFGTVSFRRFSRRMSVIGCIHGSSQIGYGLPNIGNGDSTGTAQPSLGDWWRDYGMTGTLTTRTDATHGVITLNSGALHYSAGTAHYFNIFYANGSGGETCIPNAYVESWAAPAATISITGVLPPADTALRIGPGAFYPGPGGDGSYQEIDLDVEATSIDKGNYFYGNSSFTSLGGDTLPASLIYSTKPAFFGAMAWPPFDPQNPTTSYEVIPAGYRFANNLEPGGSGGGGGSGTGTATMVNATNVIITPP